MFFGRIACGYARMGVMIRNGSIRKTVAISTATRRFGFCFSASCINRNAFPSGECPALMRLLINPSWKAAYLEEVIE